MGEFWFYCPGLRPGAVELDAAETRHALRSRRVRPGERVALFDGCGRVGWGATQSSAAGGRRAAALVVQVERVDRRPRAGRELTLVVAACKGPRLDMLVEKCTELGVARLVFAEFAHSVVRLRAEQAEGLRRTAIEACKQCRRAWLPEIELGPGVVEAAARATGPLFVAEAAAHATALGAALAKARGSATVVVGPEGGLTPQELGRIVEAGGRPAHLGNHILRVETAAIAVAALWAGGEAEQNGTRAQPNQ